MRLILDPMIKLKDKAKIKTTRYLHKKKPSSSALAVILGIHMTVECDDAS